MRLGNALGDGESDSKATGRGGAGGVRAVKAVKQPIKRHVYRLDIVVFHCQLNTAPERLQRNMDHGIRHRVFYSVIKQDRHKLPYCRLVTAENQFRQRRNIQRTVLGLRKFCKRLNRISNSFINIERLRMQQRCLFVVLTERDERLHKFTQLFGLHTSLVDPFLLSDLHFQHFQAGSDHGDGRFEFVSGVRDELLLPLGRLHDRVNGAT